MVNLKVIDVIKKKIKKNYIVFVILLFCKRIFESINFFNYFIFKKKTKYKKSLTIFDYHELSKNLNIYTTDLYNENSLYGNNLAIKNILEKQPTFEMLIEHGYHFGEFASPSAFDVNNINIITYSSVRYKHLKKKFLSDKVNRKKIKITTVGPYINYADSVLSEYAKKRIIEDYGKILLVFPSHSIEGVIYKYNTQDFINEIEKISIEFDSVFVCMYWKDIQDERYLKYKEKGYQIITAGHKNDPNFLGRLKDIIDLSDMTMSNTVGTHVGYCVSRDKPHYLFNQFQTVEGDKVKKEFKERENIEYTITRNNEVGEVINAFSNLSYLITNEQKRVVNKYWGEDKINYYVISKNLNNS